MLLQYARSADAEVIAVVQRNSAGRRAAVARCREWAERHGALGGDFYADRRGGGMGVTGLPFLMGADGEGMPPKGWVQGRLPSNGRKPRAKSPADAEMKALRWSREPIPGVPDWCESRETSTGGFYWMTPMPFVYEGAAWVLLSNAPTEGDFGAQWEEVLASRARAAKEGYLADAERRDADHG